MTEPTVAEPWTRTDRVESADADVSVLPEARAALATCQDATPCVFERYLSPDGGQSLALLRRADSMTRLDTGEAWVADWGALSLLMQACLGDPLTMPVAADPGGARLLERHGEVWRWRIVLTGANLCRLSGELTLEARADRADVRMLDADGQPWSEGGIARARDLLRARYGLTGDAPATAE